MPRAPRFYVDGAFYHVYGRITRGERIFADDLEASRFVDILHDVKRRDALTVFAWCLMANHYHLALRTSSVPLWRSMRLIQWRFARDHNRRTRQLGPVWQGRYQVRMVDDQRYLLQLIAYIHLNPVVAGVADDPARHRWSGHRELLGRGRDPLVDVDGTLVLFGPERTRARRAYTRLLRGQREQEWIGEGLGRIPRWRGGEKEDLDDGAWESSRIPVVAHTVGRREEGDAAAFAKRAAKVLGIDVAALAGPRKTREVVRAREAVAVVGVERYGIGVGELARTFGVHPGSVSRWITRAGLRRQQDPAFASRCEELEELLGRQ